MIFPEFAQAAAPVAIAMLWQGAVLALGLAICLHLAPRVPAADRFRAWAAGFGVLLALPFLPLLNGIHPAAGAAAASAAPAARAWLDLDPRWALVITALWIAGSAWRAADLAVHGLQLRKLWGDAEPIEFPGVHFEVCTTRELDRPSVIGFFRPRILLPAWLLARLTPAELRQVVLHEAEHLRRRDDWTNLMQKLALVVFPLNPALAWIERQLCHEREMACDDAVVRATGKPRAYAACLASIAERGLERQREALNLGAWRKRPELVGRVHRILKHVPGMNPAAARALLVLVGGGLAFGAVEFARAPQLVAFVAAPVIAQSSTPDLVNVDGRAMAGYRAINAVAHVPSRADVAKSLNANAASRTHSSIPATTGTSRSDKQSNPRKLDAPAFAEIETAAVESREPSNNAPQWIVLATWEQVVTIRRRPGTVADYDVDPSTAAQSAGQAAAGTTAPSAVQQWTVTQLILRLDPAQSDSGRSATPDTNSQPAQPAVIPLRDGWLVLQL